MYRSNKRSILAALVIVGAAAAHATNAQQVSQAKSLKGEELAKNARITVSQARTIALKAHPGKITDEELEKEKGGSGLRYSFDIKDRAGTHEVGVDAKTGKVLENKLEGPDAD
jgi:uncharacterized membrane protein YkoI